MPTTPGRPQQPPTRADTQLSDDLRPTLEALAGLLTLLSTSAFDETPETLIPPALAHLANLAQEALARFDAWRALHQPDALASGAAE